MILRDSLVIVTGAASGLGLATAKRLVAEGARVALVDLNAAQLTEVSAELGDSVSAFPLDVCSEPDVKSALLDIQAWGGSITGLVNCAGVNRPQKLVGRKGAHDYQQFQQVIDINLMGTVNMMRLVAEAMCDNPLDSKGQRGVIVNTASIAAYEGQVGQTAYSASKGAIVSMTLPAARDLAKNAIRINVIAPGIMATPLLLEAGEKVLAPLLEMTQFPDRLGEPEEFADAVCFLLSNTYMNGSVLRLDGAMRMS